MLSGKTNYFMERYVWSKDNTYINTNAQCVCPQCRDISYNLCILFNKLDLFKVKGEYLHVGLYS